MMWNRYQRVWARMLLSFCTALALLLSACSDEESEETTSLVDGQDSGTAASLIALINTEIDTSDLSILLNNEVVPICSENVPENDACISFVQDRQFALISIPSGDLQLDLTTPQERGSFMFLDVRPQTTILLYLENIEGVLHLTSHRRISAQDDGLNGNGRWVADDLLVSKD